MEKFERIETFKDFIGELKVTYKRTKLPQQIIKSSRDIETFIRPYFEEIIDNHEELKIIHLNRANGVVNVSHLTSGGETFCVVPIKMILREALLIKTQSIVMVHNHPSGNLKFSNGDIQISQRLQEACQIVDLTLLDSIVITRESYKSMVDEKIL